MTTLDNILTEIIGLDFKFNFATNSINFSFEAKAEGETNYRLWIEPFWRFVKDGQLILSSMTCPWHENYDTEAAYKAAFHAWCDNVKHLQAIPIKSIIRESSINDLIITWHDGTQLEIYQNDIEAEAWYIKNKDSGELYHAFPDTIKTRKLGIEDQSQRSTPLSKDF